MSSIRLIGKLSCPRSEQIAEAVVIPGPSGSIILLNNRIICQRDSFLGSRLLESSLSISTDNISSGSFYLSTENIEDIAIPLTCTVRSESGHLIVSFHWKICALDVFHLRTGTHRELLPLRSAKGSNSRANTKIVTCMSGSQHDDSGLLFLARAGQSLLQIVKIDPNEKIGSVSQPLPSSGSIISLCCHPGKPILAISFNSGSIQLWNFGDMCKDAPSELPITNDANNGLFNFDESSPVASPKYSAKASLSNESKFFSSVLPGKLKHVASLSTHEIPGFVLLSNSSEIAEFNHISFHPSREWFCAANSSGCIGVWNLEGEDIENSNIAQNIASTNDDFGAVSYSSPSRVKDFGETSRVQIIFPFGMCKENSIPDGLNSSSMCSFHPSEPVLVVVRKSSSDDYNLCILNLLDSALPCLYRAPLPSQPASLCIEPTSSRIFITWCIPSSFQNNTNVTEKCDVAILCSGAQTDRRYFNIVGSPTFIPTSIFSGTFKANSMQELKGHFIRSMPMLVKAGPGGGFDIPAMRSILYSQSLERDVNERSRGRARRLITLPGHTDDIMQCNRISTLKGHSTFQTGHLRPFRLVPGPLLYGTRRSFLILYEIISVIDGKNEEDDDKMFISNSETDMLHLPSSHAIATQKSNTVCGLAIQAAKGELDTDANLRPLTAALDACFIQLDVEDSDIDKTDGLPCVVTVENGGFKLSVYSLPDVSFLNHFQLAVPISRIFPTPPWIDPKCGKALYVLRKPSSLFDSSKSVNLSSNQFTEILIYSAPRGLKCPLLLPNSPPPMQLQENEHVVDVQFQPFDSAEEAKFWGYAGQPMVAVLTTKRILVAIAASLRVIGSTGLVTNSIKTCSSWLFLVPQSISWLGSSVMCTLEGGQVAYLSPHGNQISGVQNTVNGTIELTYKSIFGLNQGACAGGVSIVAVLPDRVCLLIRGSGGSGMVHLITHPLMPLEPLVSGLLAFSLMPQKTQEILKKIPSCKGHARLLELRRKKCGIHTNDLHQPPDSELLKLVVHSFTPPLSQPPGIPTGEGVGLCAGATIETMKILQMNGYFELACYVAGVQRSDHFALRHSTDLFYRYRPWISTENRAQAGFYLRDPFAAALETIGDDPALYDYALDPDTMVSANLPYKNSRLAKDFYEFGMQAESLGQQDNARRLYELSGNDNRLLLLLVKGYSERTKAKQNNANEHLNALCTSFKSSGTIIDPLLIASVESFLKMSGIQGADLSFEAALCRMLIPYDAIIYSFFRRKSLLAGLDPFGDNPPIQQLVRFSSETYPQTPLKPLALNSIGQWLGRCRLECIITNNLDSILPIESQSMKPMKSIEGPSDENDTSTWVSVGGNRNAEDNVCGYWRFSEGETCHNSEIRTKIEIIDLSKYKNKGFLKGTGVSLEVTTSPTDPGEARKVALAYDACFSEVAVRENDSFSSLPLRTYIRGIFLPIKRGSSLDLGPFHDDPNRSSFTLEFWVKFEKLNLIESFHSDFNDGQNVELPQYPPQWQVLAARYSTRPGADHQHLWSLTVERNGQLCLIPGPRSRREFGSEGDITRGGVCTPPGVFVTGKWCHVAMSMSVNLHETAAEVVLFSNCEKVAVGVVQFSKISLKAVIETTELVLGGEMTIPARITEVRVWAMLRDSILLHDLMEVNLSIAEVKRSRNVVIRSASSSASNPMLINSKVLPIVPPNINRFTLKNRSVSVFTRGGDPRKNRLSLMNSMHSASAYNFETNGESTNKMHSLESNWTAFSETDEQANSEKGKNHKFLPDSSINSTNISEPMKNSESTNDMNAFEIDWAVFSSMENVIQVPDEQNTYEDSIQFSEFHSKNSSENDEGAKASTETIIQPYPDQYYHEIVKEKSLLERDEKRGHELNSASFTASQLTSNRSSSDIIKQISANHLSVNSAIKSNIIHNQLKLEAPKTTYLSDSELIDITALSAEKCTSSIDSFLTNGNVVDAISNANYVTYNTLGGSTGQSLTNDSSADVEPMAEILDKAQTNEVKLENDLKCLNLNDGLNCQESNLHEKIIIMSEVSLSEQFSDSHAKIISDVIGQKETVKNYSKIFNQPEIIMKLFHRCTAYDISEANSLSPLLSNNSRYLCICSTKDEQREGSTSTSQLNIFDLLENSAERYPISTSSAIMRPGLDHQRVIALYMKQHDGKGKISIFSMDNTRQKICEQPMSAPLIFWQWLDDNVIVIVTEMSVFYWFTKSQSKPTKVFHRNYTRVAGTMTRWVRVNSYCCDEKNILQSKYAMLSIELEDCSEMLIDLHDFQTNQTQPMNALGASFVQIGGIRNALAIVALEKSSKNLELQIFDFSNSIGSPDQFSNLNAVMTCPLPSNSKNEANSYWILQPRNSFCGVIVVSKTGQIYSVEIDSSEATCTECINACSGCVESACINGNDDLLLISSADGAVVMVTIESRYNSLNLLNLY